MTKSLFRGLLYAGLLVIFPTSVARAHITSDFDASFGIQNMGIQAGTDFNRTMTSFTAFEFNYNLNLYSMDSTITLTFQELIQTNLGLLGMTRIGLGGRYYPLGLNGGRVVFDSFSSGKLWAPRPFLAISIGASNLSVDASPVYFNAFMIDVHPKIGFEIPFRHYFMFLVQVGLLKSISALSSDTADTAVSYTGFTATIGAKLVDF